MFPIARRRGAGDPTALGARMARRTEGVQTGRRHRVLSTALIAVVLLVATPSLLPAATAPRSGGSGDVGAGRAAFENNCAVCHGASAQGRGAAPSLIGVSDRHTANEIAAIIRRGRAGMPSFDARLSDAEIDDVVAFLDRISDGEVEPRQDRGMQRWWDDMMWDGSGTAAFMVIWMIFGLLLIGLVVVGIVWLVRQVSSNGGGRVEQQGSPPSGPASGSARDELDRRYARGEISREEYRTMRDDLEG